MEYKREKRICQNCKKDFTIESEDFNFYEKIKVPPPTFCPECRMIKRMVFRDYRVLYRRKSDKTEDTIFSIIPQESLLKVWDRDIWWGDSWDSLDYGKDYDFNKSFFSQLKELISEVPYPSQTCWNMVNSEYCTGANYLKNCYLVFVSTNSEDCIYGAEINKTKSSIDVTRLESSELCYESFALTKCYQTFFSSHCENCIDVWFSRDLSDCNSCFGCVNLRNKKYCIWNIQYTKEEYEKNIKEFNISSYKSIKEIKEKVNLIFDKSIRKYIEGHYNSNISGEYINNSKNVLKSYYVNQGEDCKYLQCFFSPSVKNCYDCTEWGENSELCYECSSVGAESYNNKFNYRCSRGTHDSEYSFNCIGCGDVFACSGLRNKQYCILNKQYEKEEYYKLKEKIIKHMNTMPYIDEKGIVYKYGEFFPIEFSPFSYNESLAQDYFPLTKEEVLKEGYRWKEKIERNYQIEIKNENIPDDIKDVDKSIINKVIECADKEECNHGCIEAFKIIKEEFQFYKRMNLPLPRFCPNCRYFERIKMRNGIKLYNRKCMKEGCNNEFETSYAPDRPEVVYCEKCYQQEVY